MVKQSNNYSHPSLLKHGAREYIAKYQKEMTDLGDQRLSPYMLLRHGGSKNKMETSYNVTKAREYLAQHLMIKICCLF